ncbi:hypothetical protein BN1708_009363, partial [Verticillium longisporum]
MALVNLITSTALVTIFMTLGIFFYSPHLVGFIPTRYVPSADARDDHIQVLVLGDVGRSPRMQYHAISVIKNGGRVDLVGYNESPLHPQLVDHDRATLYPLPELPALLKNKKLPFFILGPFKVIWQACATFYVMAYQAPASRWIIIQNPPSIPTLHLALIISVLRGSHLLVDWHNYGWSILATTRGRSNRFLVVVGDQSSGKSSVLESLTGFAFPRAAGLCTRYATQITSRRDDSESIDVSIIPHPSSSESRAEQLRGFQRSINIEDLALAEVFADANNAMGIRGDGDDPSSTDLTTFSEDILKIVISGPTQQHLTIIDVPGIFRTSTENLTTDDDILLVRNMVKKYITDQRTIILAVIPCNVDIATQEVLTMAKEVDPDGLLLLSLGAVAE